jgi:uncharacterized protein
MKLLLILVLALVGVWWWRNQRRPGQGRAGVVPRPPRQAGSTQDMVECPVCRLHVARSDALSGSRGAYCSVEHRRQAEP